MFKELIESIGQNAVRAAAKEAEIFTVPGEPAGVYFLRGETGQLVRHESAQVRTYRADSLDTLARLTAAGTDGRIFSGVTTTTHAGNGVVTGVFNDRDRATYTLPFSTQFLRLCAMDAARGEDFNQVGLYKLLRTQLAGCWASLPDLLKLVGKVDVKKVAEASGSVNRRGVSMNRSMVAEAGGADLLPERIPFYLPVFTGLHLLSLFVNVSLDLNPESETFSLYVLPGEITNAITEAAEWLYNAAGRAVENVTEADEVATPVYEGHAN